MKQKEITYRNCRIVVYSYRSILRKLLPPVIVYFPDGRVFDTYCIADAKRVIDQVIFKTNRIEGIK